MRKLRWGLVGCGDIARKRVAPALRDLPDCEFVAVSRARAELAESFAREFGARRWHRTADDLFADPGIEAVYIATPVHFHAGQTVAAARAGKHVLCEKPMALSVSECERMIDACREAGVTLGVAYYRRFYPVLVRAREILVSGEIGEPVFAEVCAFEFYDPPPGDQRGWFLRKAESGGGPMFDFGCHRIEALLTLLGPVAGTRGMTGNAALRSREVEDTASALFRFASGAQAVLTVTHAAFEARDTLDLFCTDGSLHIPRLNAGEMTVLTRSGARTEMHPPDPNFHRPLIADFTRAALEGRAPEVGGDTGREVNRILEEIYQG
jgi:predicted dehydrogenase